MISPSIFTSLPECWGGGGCCRGGQEAFGAFRAMSCPGQIIHRQQKPQALACGCSWSSAISGAHHCLPETRGLGRAALGACAPFRLEGEGEGRRIQQQQFWLEQCEWGRLPHEPVPWDQHLHEGRGGGWPLQQLAALGELQASRYE